MFLDPQQKRIFLSNVHLFGKLDDEQLDLLTEAFTPHLFQRGEKIFEAGGDANLFFLLYSGKVQIQRFAEGEDDIYEDYEPGDYFGQDALSENGYRQANALALEDSIVLEIPGERLSDLERDLPDLGYRANLARRSFELKWQVPLRWREPGETVFYIARRHGIFLVLRLLGPAVLVLAGLLVAAIGEASFGTITPVILGGILLFLGLAWTAWQIIDWSNDYFIVTDRRVIYLERIIFLYDARTEAPMEAILSVSHGTSLLGRWFNYGVITVKSFTGTVRFDGIEAPREIQALIERILLRARSRQKQEQRRTIDRTLRGRLRPELARPAPPPPPKPAGDEEEEEEQPVEYTPGVLQKALSNLFFTRWEENGVITYRKHWLVLIQNIWAPTLLILAVIILMIGSLAGWVPFLSSMGITGIGLVLLIVLGVWWWYQYADWGNDIYVVTADQIIDVYKKPLGTETRKTAPLKNILSIEYRRLGFLGYLFNFGTVFIKVGETTFDFDYVYNPSEVQREIFKRYNEFKYREKKAQEDEEAARMADWIEGYNRLQES